MKRHYLCQFKESAVGETGAAKKSSCAGMPFQSGCSGVEHTIGIGACESNDRPAL